MASKKVYEFYTELGEFEPLIWRRIQVPSDITVAQLGYIVMTLFEMKASHLFAVFRLEVEDGQRVEYRYEIPSKYEDPFGGEPPLDATKVKLDSICRAETIFNVNYDFGDDWCVFIQLEKIIEKDDAFIKELPMATEGSGFGIVEDCGGIPGLWDLVEAFNKKRGSLYKELSEWMGTKNFDINAFDLKDMNFRLHKLPAIFKGIYEKGQYPSQASIGLIERDYLDKKPEPTKPKTAVAKTTKQKTTTSKSATSKTAKPKTTKPKKI